MEHQDLGQPRSAGGPPVQGSLVVDGTSSAALWTNRTWDYPKVTLHVLPDGNVVLYHYTRPIWATNTHQPAPEQLRNHPLAAAMS